MSLDKVRVYNNKVMTDAEFGKALIEYVGGQKNIIVVFNCYTRIRVNIHNFDDVDTNKIKTLPNVMGVVTSGAQIQVIVGPGRSVKLTQVINQLLEVGTFVKQERDIQKAEERYGKTDTANKDFAKNKEQFRGGLNAKFSATMKKVAGIFVPIIPAFIACGLLLALFEVVGSSIDGFKDTTFGTIFNVVSSSVFSVLSVIVGYNACKEFGGDGILGACLAGILTNPLLGDIEHPIMQLGSLKLYAGLGGVISIILAAIAAAYFEKLLRKFMPNIVDAFLTPLIALVVTSAAGLFIFMPVGGYIALGIEMGVNAILNSVPFLLGIVPMFYLVMVLFGVHHGLIPISQTLIDTTTHGDIRGYSILVPVQLMAGAAEVGAAIYFILTTKNKKMKRTVIQSIPIGILGIDEPLIWGMSFPLKRLFIPIGIAGGISGGVLSTFFANLKCGSLVSESTGIEASLVMSNNTGKWVYALAFIAAIILGFLITAVIGYKEVIETPDPITGEIHKEEHETSLFIKYYNQYRLKHPKKQISK